MGYGNNVSRYDLIDSLVILIPLLNNPTIGGADTVRVLVLGSRSLVDASFRPILLRMLSISP